MRPAQLARLPVNVVHIQLAEASYGAGFLLLEAGGLEALDAVNVAEDDVSVNTGVRGTGRHPRVIAVHHVELPDLQHPLPAVVGPELGLVLSR